MMCVYCHFHLHFLSQFAAEAYLQQERSAGLGVGHFLRLFVELAQPIGVYGDGKMTCLVPRKGYLAEAYEASAWGQ